MCKVTLFSRHNPHFLSPSGSANCKQMQSVYFMNSLSVHNLKVSTETKFKTFCHHSYSFTNSPCLCGKVSYSIPGLSIPFWGITIIGHKWQTFGSRVSCVEEGSELLYASPRWFHKAVKQDKKKIIEHQKFNQAEAFMVPLLKHIYKEQWVWGTGGTTGAITSERGSQWWRRYLRGKCCHG